MANITTGKKVFVFAGGGSFGAIQVGGMKRRFLAADNRTSCRIEDGCRASSKARDTPDSSRRLNAGLRTIFNGGQNGRPGHVVES
jgi:hypothetical protein